MIISKKHPWKHVRYLPLLDVSKSVLGFPHGHVHGLVLIQLLHHLIHSVRFQSVKLIVEFFVLFVIIPLEKKNYTRKETACKRHRITLSSKNFNHIHRYVQSTSMHKNIKYINMYRDTCMCMYISMKKRRERTHCSRFPNPDHLRRTRWKNS